MGLDMYLTRRHYVRHWDHNGDDNFEISIRKKNDKPTGIDTSKISEVIEEVAYWRKANHIHAWFVENVQNGVDDCGEYYVPKEKLEELMIICERIIEDAVLEEGNVSVGKRYRERKWEEILEKGKIIVNQELCEKLLPTQGGFFFGNTDYNQYYFMTVMETHREISKALQYDPTNASFYYSASW